MGEEEGSAPKSMINRVRRNIKVKNFDYDSLDTNHKWTQAEEKVLLKCLHEFGVTRIGKISKCLPKKSETQVKKYLYLQWLNAFKVKKAEVLKSVKKSCGHTEKLAMYPSVVASLVQKDNSRANRKRNHALSSISNAVLLISELESHPDPSLCHSVDFKVLYNAVYMALRGYPLPTMNSATRKYLIDTFAEVLNEANTLQNKPHQQSAPDEAEDLKIIVENKFINPLELSQAALSQKPNLTPSEIYPGNLSDWLSDDDKLFLYS